MARNKSVLRPQFCELCYKKDKANLVYYAKQWLCPDCLNKDHKPQKVEDFIHRSGVLSDDS